MVSIIRVIASIAFLILSLCVELNTLFIWTSLPLYSSINLVRHIWFLCVPVGVFSSFLDVLIAVGHVQSGFPYRFSRLELPTILLPNKAQGRQ